MPLHLLPKKSWNVYSAENIAKVKRDEAAAAEAEYAAEQRMQEEDAAARMRILRGEPALTPRPPIISYPTPITQTPDPRPVKRAKRVRGEDDTDREIRQIRENNALAAKAALTIADPDQSNYSQDPVLSLTRIPSTGSAHPCTDPIDRNGNIDLFPGAEAQALARLQASTGREKNADRELEKQRKARALEDQYTMRFSNAAGLNKDIRLQPWYDDLQRAAEDQPGKDVWGRADPRRKERATRRLDLDDPMTAIKRGVAGVRRVEGERRKWRAERMGEVEELDLDAVPFGNDLVQSDCAQERQQDRLHRHRHRRHRSRRRSKSPDGGRADQRPDRTGYRRHHGHSHGQDHRIRE